MSLTVLALTSIGIRCCTERFSNNGLLLLLATFTIAAQTSASTPGSNSSILASFQKFRNVDSFFRMKISPTDMSSPLFFWDLAMEISHRLSKYSRFHWLVNYCSRFLWCCALLVRDLWVLISSKLALLDRKLIPGHHIRRWWVLHLQFLRLRSAQWQMKVHMILLFVR